MHGMWLYWNDLFSDLGGGLTPNRVVPQCQRSKRKMALQQAVVTFIVDVILPAYCAYKMTCSHENLCVVQTNDSKHYTGNVREGHTYSIKNKQSKWFYQVASEKNGNCTCNR